MSNERLSYLGRLRVWFSESIVMPVYTMEADELGKCTSVGIWGGIFPVPAVTTVITLILLWAMPANFSGPQKGLAIAINLLVAPLQFLVMPAFVLAGGMLANGLSCDPISLMDKFRNPEASFMDSILSSSACLTAGIFVWVITTIPALLAMSTTVTFAARMLRPNPRKSSFEMKESYGTNAQ